MPILPVSPGRHAARVVEVLVRGLAVVLGMLVLVTFFTPLVPALLLWPVLRWNRVRWVLSAFLHAAGSIAELGRPGASKAEDAAPSRGWPER
ncbi:hypothetical protein [Actinoallomurus liliacearum]